MCADWTVEERKKGKASEDIGIVVEHDPVSGLGNVQGSFWQWGNEGEAMAGNTKKCVSHSTLY